MLDSYLMNVQPPIELIQQTAERLDLSINIVAEVWYAGYLDGHNNYPLYALPDDDLQPIYALAHDQGQRESKIRRDIADRPGA